jgi:aminocarboxymuconate-semialdehyde decarboxylase
LRPGAIEKQKGEPSVKDARDSSEKPAIGRREFIKLGAAAGAMIGGASASMAAPQKLPEATEQTLEGWKLSPRGTTKPVSVDVHAHWSPEAYTRILVELGEPEDASGGSLMPLKQELDHKVQWMDAHGVQMFIMTLGGVMPWQWVSKEPAVRLAQAVNDSAVEAHNAYPDRFCGAIELPANDAAASLEEVNRMAGKPGIRAVHLPPTIEGREYVFEPAFAPVLARCEELGYPLVFHPLEGAVNYYGVPHTHVSDPYLDKVRYWSTLGFPFETATLAAKFIVLGILDKYPKLEIVLPNAGGCFPYLAGRVGYSLTRRKFPLQHPYRDYLRRFHYDSMTYDLEALRFLVSLVGADRVLVGTDNTTFANPNFAWPNAIIEHMELKAGDEYLILSGNAKRLFRLQPVKS